MNGQASSIISILFLFDVISLIALLSCFQYYDSRKQRLIDYYEQFKKGKNIEFDKWAWYISGVSVFQKIPPYESNEDFYKYEKTLRYYETLQVLKKVQYILLIIIALLAASIAVISLLK